MKLFGLACEGITDQVVLENILCGYFENLELGNEIAQLQPPFDETDQQRGEGGWRMLLKYLRSTNFRDDVLNTEFLILQIDTDISAELLENHDSTTSVEILMSNVIAELVKNINQGEADFYEQQARKIIFAISVHSLECWLVAHYSEQSEIHNCCDVLKTLINPKEIRVVKKPRNYEKLSQPFLEKQHIAAVAAKDYSFQLFIQSLEKTKDIVQRKTARC